MKDADLLLPGDDNVEVLDESNYKNKIDSPIV